LKVVSIALAAMLVSKHLDNNRVLSGLAWVKATI